jgi:hypothetical protein
VGAGVSVGIAARFVLAAAVLALLSAACGSSAPSAAPGRAVVTVAPDDGADFFAPVHRARAITVDGIVAEWRINESGPPVDLPAGTYRLEVFTVFLSDVVTCVEGVGGVGGAGSTCLQPTLGPSQVCAIDIDVPAGGEVRALFRPSGQGLCQLVPEGPAPT